MNPVLVDTSVWVDHFRRPHEDLIHLLERDLVLVHPWVIGEIAGGTPPMRSQTLVDLASLRHAQQASQEEVLSFLEREQLFGLGCGWVDLHLLASTCLTASASLWTLDQRLDALAHRLQRSYRPPMH
jgi:predicted nucleic acid-binding protein